MNNNSKILILGNRSFVAKGLYDKLSELSYPTDCFTRGTNSKSNSYITGDVFKLRSNPYLQSEYDSVINFIIIKDGGVEENIQYISELVEFCIIKKVKHLVHFSSIIVYSNKEKSIDEDSNIKVGTLRNEYTQIKAAVDRYLNSLTDLPFTITFIRPGYVVTDDREASFIKKFPLNIALILGGKKSVMPVVQRDDIHQALIKLLETSFNQKILLFIPSEGQKKFDYARKVVPNCILIGLPEFFILAVSNLLFRFKLINQNLHNRINGVFSRTQYDSRKTEQFLNFKFK